MEIDLWLLEVGVWWMEELGEGDQKVQISSYKINSRDVMYNMKTTVNNTVLYI